MEIPYTPYSTAEPAGGSERLSVSAPPAAFGANIGAALEHLGTTTEQVGSELFSRAMALQDLKNENDARDAQAKYATQSSALQAAFDSSAGKDSADNLQAHLKALNDLRLGIRGDLGTAHAQRFYDRDTLPFMQRDIFSSARHAGDQNRDYTLATMGAKEDMLKKNTFENPNDTKAVQSNKDQLADITAQKAELKFGVGPDSPIVKDAVMNSLSSHKASQLMGLSHTNPTGAMAAAEDAKKSGELNEPDYLKIQGSVEGRGVAVAASNITNTFLADPKNFKDGELQISQTNAIKKIGDMADEAGISPQLKASAIAHFESRMYQMRIATNQDRLESNSKIDDLIRNNKITTAQQLLAQPGIDGLIDMSNPKLGLKQYPQSYINRLNNRDRGPSDLEQLAIAKGLSKSTDPNEQEKFLNTDFTAWNINGKDRQELEDAKKKLMSDPRGDATVQRAYSILLGTRGAELNTLGVDKKTESTTDDYYHFQGALQEALEVFKQDNKRPPSMEEIRDKIGPEVINRQVTKQGWFGKYNEPAFKSFNRANIDDIPDAVKRKMISDSLAAGGSSPTDLQMLQKWNTEIFNKLYGGTSAGPSASAPQSK